MDVVLTGGEATRALQLYSALGTKNARFDGHKVARAIKTVAGRARLTAAIKQSKPLPAPGFSVWVRIRPEGRTSGPHPGKRTRQKSPKSADPPLLRSSGLGPSAARSARLGGPGA